MSTPTLLAQAQQKLAESLAQLPEGKRGALVAVVTTEGIKAAICRQGESGLADRSLRAEAVDGRGD